MTLLRQRFLQFRLGSHSLPIAAGRFSGGQHVPRADRICSHCGPGTFADELHVVHECPLLQPLRQKYCALFTSETNTIFGQKDHMQVFTFILDCLDFLSIGSGFPDTCDQTCWLAKACKILSLSLSDDRVESYD